ENESSACSKTGGPVPRDARWMRRRGPGSASLRRMAIVRIARIRLICLLTPALLALTSCGSAPSNVSVHAGAVLPISSTWPNAAPVSVYYRDQVVTYFVGVPIPPNRPAYLGAPPYPPPSYSVAPGFALPPGLTLETDTGVVFGTPTTTGVYSVAIGAT